MPRSPSADPGLDFDGTRLMRRASGDVPLVPPDLAIEVVMLRHEAGAPGLGGSPPNISKDEVISASPSLVALRTADYSVAEIAAEIANAVRGGGPIVASTREESACQYSPFMTKKEPRMVPARRDFWRANLNRVASSAGISIPSESLKPTARLPESSRV